MIRSILKFIGDLIDAKHGYFSLTDYGPKPSSLIPEELYVSDNFYLGALVANLGIKIIWHLFLNYGPEVFSNNSIQDGAAVAEAVSELSRSGEIGSSAPTRLPQIVSAADVVAELAAEEAAASAEAAFPTEEADLVAARELFVPPRFPGILSGVAGLTSLTSSGPVLIAGLNNAVQASALSEAADNAMVGDAFAVLGSTNTAVLREIQSCAPVELSNRQGLFSLLTERQTTDLAAVYENNLRRIDSGLDITHRGYRSPYYQYMTSILDVYRFEKETSYQGIINILEQQDNTLNSTFTEEFKEYADERGQQAAINYYKTHMERLVNTSYTSHYYSNWYEYEARNQPTTRLTLQRN